MSEANAMTRRDALGGAALGAGAAALGGTSAMAQAGPRKTFVLIHGAWHGGWCWRRVADILEAKGHKVFTPTLTGLGERSHLLAKGIDVSTHVTDVVNLFKWEGLSDAVLCGHSYGGLVVSGVAERIAPKIGSIVFLDAFIPDNGDSMMDLTGQAVIEATRAAEQAGALGVPPRKAEAFGVNEKDRAWIDSLTGLQPLGCFLEKMKITGARDRIATV